MCLLKLPTTNLIWSGWAEGTDGRGNVKYLSSNSLTAVFPPRVVSLALLFLCGEVEARDEAADDWVEVSKSDCDDDSVDDMIWTDHLVAQPKQDLKRVSVCESTDKLNWAIDKSCTKALTCNQLHTYRGM